MHHRTASAQSMWFETRVSPHKVARQAGSSTFPFLGGVSVLGTVSLAWLCSEHIASWWLYFLVAFKAQCHLFTWRVDSQPEIARLRHARRLLFLVWWPVEFSVGREGSMSFRHSQLFSWMNLNGTCDKAKSGRLHFGGAVVGR